MHTSHFEDKEKFWALTLGAEVFVYKDFYNLNLLVDKIKELRDSIINNQFRFINIFSNQKDLNQNI